VRLNLPSPQTRQVLPTCVVRVFTSVTAMERGYVSAKSSYRGVVPIKVSIDDLDVEMTQGNNGVIFAVTTMTECISESCVTGRLPLSGAKVKSEWAMGSINGNDLIAYFEEQADAEPK